MLQHILYCPFENLQRRTPKQCFLKVYTRKPAAACMRSLVQLCLTSQSCILLELTSSRMPRQLELAGPCVSCCSEAPGLWQPTSKHSLLLWCCPGHSTRTMAHPAQFQTALNNNKCMQRHPSFRIRCLLGAGVPMGGVRLNHMESVHRHGQERGAPQHASHEP